MEIYLIKFVLVKIKLWRNLKVIINFFTLKNNIIIIKYKTMYLICHFFNKKILSFDFFSL